MMTTNALTTTQPREVTRSKDASSGSLYRPTTDVYETNDAVVLELELPGAALEDVDVSIERRVLTVKATVPTRDREGWRLISAEYEEGDYERRFVLSEDVDQDQISAELKDGLLIFTLPKSDAIKPRKIQVQTA